MDTCICKLCKRLVASRYTWAEVDGIIYFMCVVISGDTVVYVNETVREDPDNLFVETHVAYIMGELEDELAPNYTPNPDRFLIQGTNQYVYGINPLCWFTDNSTILGEVTYTHADNPDITLLVDGTCSETSITFSTCPCSKCRDYFVDPRYMLVSPAPEEGSSISILGHANVCVDPPEQRSNPSHIPIPIQTDMSPSITTTTRRPRPPPSQDDFDAYLEDLLLSADMIEPLPEPTPEVMEEMSRPILPEVENAVVSITPLAPLVPRDRRNRTDTDSETSSIYSDDPIFDDMPTLTCEMPMLVNGVRRDVQIDTDLENTDDYLFGGVIDISTRQERIAFSVIDPNREWSFIDDALMERHESGPRFRRTTRRSVYEQPDFAILPNNGLRYSAALLTVRNLDRPSVTWMRDDKRDNVIWTTGHYCLLSGQDMPCGCGICRTLEEHNGVTIGYLNGFYFVRAMRSSYPYGQVVTDNQDDARRRSIYYLVEENIHRVRSRTRQITASNMHYANVSQTATHETPTNTRTNDEPTKNPTKKLDIPQRKRSNSEPTQKTLNDIPKRPTTPPASKYAIYELNNRHNPLIDNCFHLRGRTARRKWKLNMRLIISDGGASKSMFSDRRLFRNYKECDNAFVKMADGTMCRVLGTGDVGKLRDVLHVENLVFDLVSESWCDKMGMTGTWKDGVRTVYDTNGTIFYTSYLEDGLYVVNPMLLGIDNPRYVDEVDLCLASKAQVVNELHETLGHIDKDRIQRGIASGHIPWLHDAKPNNLKKCSDKCIVCQLAKSQRRSFTQPLRTVLTRGQHTYLDLYGPVDTPSLINGNTYVAGFIDAYSAHL